MTLVRRFCSLGALSLGLVVFWAGAAVLGLDESGRLVWSAAPQLAGPFAATVLCLFAARRSAGGDVGAWLMFAAGSMLYLCGNLLYLGYALAGVAPGFPSIPEAMFFVMAAFFASGVSRYGQVAPRAGAVQFYNFLLIYGAVTFGCLFTLNVAIKHSVLSEFGTLFAFAYPALWISVAAFGAISYLLYDHRERAFPFVLLLLAIIAEATADCIYAVKLMAGSYRQGGATQLLWVASAGLLVWSAAEQILMTRAVRRPLPPRRIGRDRISAAVPAAALAIVLVAASMSGTFGYGLYQALSTGVSVLLAVLVALREYSIIRTQGALAEAANVSLAGLKESQRRLTSILQSTSDSVVVLDRESRIEFFNDGALKLIPELGTSAAGDSFWPLFPEDRRARFESALGQAVNTLQPVEMEFFSESRGMWFELRAYPGPNRISLFFRDISETRRVHEAIKHQARHDSLTGLANRLLFQEQMDHAVRSGRPTAVLLLDLDSFKDINDTKGHLAGDHLLSSFADRLRSCVSPSDSVARLGGDEFGVIVTGEPDQQAVERLAGRILAASSQPHRLNGLSLHVGVSIGIAVATDGKAAESLFRRADIALYVAKADGSATYRIFDPRMEAAAEERQSLRLDLETALENQEFELLYQPLVDLQSGAVTCFEALLRWRHPTRGTVTPDLFIAAAEESGLIIPIGNWVLRTACAQAMTWPDGISLAVNLSTRQFGAGTLVQSVSDALREAELDPKRLELEITESVLLKDSSANLQTLEQFRLMGVRVALDDFGTGYSSLSYLQKFEFSKMKIDRSFIDGLPDSEASCAIVTAVIGLGRSLGIKVTAEGVETEAQYEWIRGICHEAQGYLLSRPVPPSDIPLLIEQLNFRAFALRARAESRAQPPSTAPIFSGSSLAL